MDDSPPITLGVVMTSFSRTIDGARTTLAHADLTTELETLYRKFTWIYDSFAANPSTRVMRGRHPVLIGPVGGAGCVVKRFHHGGAVAALWKDRFIGTSRFRRHFEAVRVVSDGGIRTPAILFLTWRRAGAVYRGELGTSLIETGMDADRLFFHIGEKRAGEIAAEIGSVVRRLHQLPILHRDLNLMNFFIGSDEEVHLLDLDKARVGRLPSAAECKINLLRLERSIRKQGRDSDPALVDTIVTGVRHGYSR